MSSAPQPTDPQPTDPKPTDPTAAARAYQGVVAGLTGAADRLRRADLARAADLEGAFPARDKAMLAAEQRARLTAMVVALHWEAAVEQLWDEQWMTLRPRPTPVPADPARIDDHESELEQRGAELREVVNRRWYRPSGS